jgi:DNA-directed RNA polymerase subunit RPC12/RpoP
MDKIKIPPLDRKWIKCPYCGAKTVIYDNTALCSGVHIKCTRGCKREFEIIIKDGKQVL